MLIIEKMKNTQNLSTSQQAIIDFMINEKHHLHEMTLEDIAKHTYTSPSALIRVAKKFGYQGFVEFKKVYLEELNYLDTHFDTIDANIPFIKTDNIMAISHKIATLERETIEDTMSLIDHDSLRQALNYMKQADTIHYCAVSFSSLLGENFALKMSRIGKRVSLCQLESEYLYSSSLVKENDIAIVVSYSGGFPLIKKMIDMYKSHHIPVIAITSFGQSYVREHADVALTISTREKMYSKIAGFSNETSIKLILDILYSCYFSLDYDKNFQFKKELSQMLEKHKVAHTDIINEND